MDAPRSEGFLRFYRSPFKAESHLARILATGAVTRWYANILGSYSRQQYSRTPRPPWGSIRVSTNQANEALIAKAVGGDGPVLEELLLSYSPRLSRHISEKLPASLQSTVGVDDILQQTFTESFATSRD